MLHTTQLTRSQQVYMSALKRSIPAVVVGRSSVSSGGGGGKGRLSLGSLASSTMIHFF